MNMLFYLLSEIYENARAKLSKAERDSDIQTDLDTGETKEIGRGARRKRCLYFIQTHANS